MNSIIIITAVIWTRIRNITLQVKTLFRWLRVTGPHPLLRARSLRRKLVPNVQLWIKHPALPLRKGKSVSQWVIDKGKQWSDSSLLNRSESVSEWVSESVSDKHCQWSDSGPVKRNTLYKEDGEGITGCSWFQSHTAMFSAVLTCIGPEIMVLLNQVVRVDRLFLLHVFIWSCGSFF